MSENSKDAQLQSHLNWHLFCSGWFHRLISSHPALVNAIILVLHSVAGSMPAQSSASSSRNVSASSYSDMPGEHMKDGAVNTGSLQGTNEYH